MIHDQEFPMFLWAEATNKVVYIQNKSPHYILGNKTPEEAFSGVKPEVGHLRIFGFPVYIHVPKEKISKMEPSGRKGTFVGYNETSKAYRIYIPGQKQIEVSQDVTFDEEETFQRSRESRMDVVVEEEKEAPSDTVLSTLDIHPSDGQREEALEEPTRACGWA
jgi:hypothetical protein